jgi:hypothetical protein
MYGFKNILTRRIYMELELHVLAKDDEFDEEELDEDEEWDEEDDEDFFDEEDEDGDEEDE